MEYKLRSKEFLDETILIISLGFPEVLHAWKISWVKLSGINKIGLAILHNALQPITRVLFSFIRLNWTWLICDCWWSSCLRAVPLITCDEWLNMIAEGSKHSLMHNSRCLGLFLSEEKHLIYHPARLSSIWRHLLIQLLFCLFFARNKRLFWYS